MALTPFHPLMNALPLHYVVKILYDGDYDTAARVARHLRHNYARPPAWVTEFLGPRTGRH